jgi:hypothetical protein
MNKKFKEFVKDNFIDGTARKCPKDGKGECYLKEYDCCECASEFTFNYQQKKIDYLELKLKIQTDLANVRGQSLIDISEKNNPLC